MENIEGWGTTKSLSHTPIYNHYKPTTARNTWCLKKLRLHPFQNSGR